MKASVLKLNCVSFLFLEGLKNRTSCRIIVCSPVSAWEARAWACSAPWPGESSHGHFPSLGFISLMGEIWIGPDGTSKVISDPEILWVFWEHPSDMEENCQGTHCLQLMKTYAVVLSWGWVCWLPTQGHLAMSEDLCGCHSWRWWCVYFWQFMVETRVVAKLLTSHHTALYNKEWPGPWGQQCQSWATLACCFPYVLTTTRTELLLSMHWCPQTLAMLLGIFVI